MSTVNLKVLIPVRGKDSSKLKLREEVSSKLVSEVVERILLRTLESLKQTGLDPVVLTAEANLANNLTKLDITSIIDDGSSLNLAIENAILNIDTNFLMVVMADLPGLNVNTMKKVLSLHSRHKYLIAPTSDGGTAMAILPKAILTQKLFGPNSASRIEVACDDLQIPLAIIHIENLSRDLDDIGDWNYWKENGLLAI